MNKEKEVLKCSVCNKPVVRVGNELLRSCKHDKEPIIAEMKAMMYGIGKLNQK